MSIEHNPINVLANRLSVEHNVPRAVAQAIILTLGTTSYVLGRDLRGGAVLTAALTTAWHELAGPLGVSHETMFRWLKEAGTLVGNELVDSMKAYAATNHGKEASARHSGTIDALIEQIKK